MRLARQGGSWLDDRLFSRIHLPNLRALALHSCPSLTAAGVLPLLRSATHLESLYIGLAAVVSLARPQEYDLSLLNV
jgi:hypothetical protein